MPRGEVTVTAGDASYTLRLTINAICNLEEETGRRFKDLAEDLSDGSMVMARKIMRHALMAHHPDTTEEMAGDLMSMIGFERASTVIASAIQAAFPAPKKGTKRR